MPKSAPKSTSTAAETAPFDLSFVDAPLAEAFAGDRAVTVFFSGGGEAEVLLSDAAEAADKVSEGQVRRALSEASGERGETVLLRAPHGMSAPMLALVGLGAKPLDAGEARKLGAGLARSLSAAKQTAAHIRLEGVGASPAQNAYLSAELALGLRLRAYRFEARKSKPEKKPFAAAALAAGFAGEAEKEYAPLAALADGVAFTRDLVHEPANILTPKEFADRVAALESHGLKVEVLGEDKLAELGMGALLGVGQGSRRESDVVVVEWRGAPEDESPPLALVGKGVCFDTGGISIKPAAGMEEMTMDMGGAGVVAGVMKALALRKSPVNVVGLLGLVENMPDGDAQRPGDVVTSMSGQTIEVINTDAEGRLVLADVMHYAQDRFKPKRMVDLATLTGAVIIALGHEKAGLFSNDDDFAEEIENAAEIEGEGIWRLPLGAAYDKALKSRIADVKNTGGRPASSITAAMFLQRFVQDGVAWAHLDIAGVALTKEDGPVWPKGASGWGVATLVRLAESAAGD